MSTPCLEILLERFPKARLCLIAPKNIIELFRADTRIYACFEDATKQAKNRFKATWQLGRTIRSKLAHNNSIDIAITLTNHFYSALLLFALGAKVRIGYKRVFGKVLLTHICSPLPQVHQVESYVALLDMLPQAHKKPESTPASHRANHQAISPRAIPPLRLCAKPLDSREVHKHIRIGLNPGAAYGSAKCWDKEHYARVGAYFAMRGAEILIYGVAQDSELAEEILTLMDSLIRDAGLNKQDSKQDSSLITILDGSALDSSDIQSLRQISPKPPSTEPNDHRSTPANRCGKTTIQSLLQELQTLDLFITNDSGSMHIAAALGVPMVAIFGPTNMRETAPWKAQECIVLNLNLSCAPCKKRICPLHHHKCMKDLRPEIVIESSQKLLARTTQSTRESYAI